MAATKVMSAVDPLGSHRHVALTRGGDTMFSLLNAPPSTGLVANTALDPQLFDQILTALGSAGQQVLKSRLRANQSRGKTDISMGQKQSQRYSASALAYTNKQASPRSSQLTDLSIDKRGSTTTDETLADTRRPKELMKLTEGSRSERQYAQKLQYLIDRWTRTGTKGESLAFMAEGDTESPHCELVKPLKEELDVLLDTYFGSDTTRGAGKDGYTGTLEYERHEYGIHNQLRQHCRERDAFLTIGGTRAAEDKALHLYDEYKSGTAPVPDLTFCSPLLRNQQTASSCRKVHDLFTEGGEHPFAYLWALREQAGCVSSAVATPEHEFDAPQLRGKSFGAYDEEWDELWFENGDQLDQRAELLKAIALHTMDGIYMRTGKNPSLKMSGHANLGRHVSSKFMPSSASIESGIRNGQSTLFTFKRGGLQGTDKSFMPIDAQILYLDRSPRVEGDDHTDFEARLAEKHARSSQSSWQTSRTASSHAGKPMDAFGAPSGIAVA